MMEKKKKHSPLFWVIISISIILILLIAIVIVNLPKSLSVSDSSLNLSSLADGTYMGECDNGLVFVKVEVEVQNHSITNVHILEHRNGMGKDAESIVDSVISSQSVEVDAVSGATISSQTILKAIESALSK